jgi:hypothetical protein
MSDKDRRKHVVGSSGLSERLPHTMPLVEDSLHLLTVYFRLPDAARRELIARAMYLDEHIAR